MLYNGASGSLSDAALASRWGVGFSIPFDVFAFSGTEDRVGGFSGMQVRESL